MAEYTRLQNSFVSGYVDPTLHGLITSDMYNSGLKECRNFIPSSLGYLYRRPGTRYLGVNLDSIGQCRIHALKADVGATVAIISEGEIRFYFLNDAGVLEDRNIRIVDSGNSSADDDDVIVSVNNSIPWKAEDLDELDIYEFEGSLYIVHEDYPPHVVESIDGNYYELSLGEDYVEVPYTPSPDDKFYHLEDVSVPEGFECHRVEFQTGGLEKFDRPLHYPSCQTFKGGRWFLSGCRYSPATIWASKAPSSNGDYRFNDFGGGSYKLIHQKYSMQKDTTFSTSEMQMDIESVQYTNDSSGTRVEDLGYVDPYTYTVPPVNNRTIYRRYREDGQQIVYDTADLPEANDAVKNYTKRLVIITEAESYTLKSDMQYDDAIELSESDMYGSRVNWLLTQQRVIAGTSRSIWMDNGSAATPTDFDMVKTLGTTTSRVKPVMLSSMIIFVPSDLKSVKAFYYDNDAGGYQLIDLSASARSLFRESTVKKISMVEGRENILWVLLSNGKLLSCTIGATYGWAEHEIGGDGNVISMYPYHADTGEGSLFLVVDRNGMETVERLVLEDLVNTDVFRLCDCSVDLNPEGGALDLSEVDAFTEGNDVQIVSGGWPRASFGFVKDDVEIGPGSKEGTYIGFPYTSKVTMLWQELPTNASQSSLSFFRKATSMALLVYRSAGAECGWYAGGKKHLDPFQRIAKSNQVEPTYADYYTGIVKLSVPSNTSEQVNATVECTQPLPMTIQAIETRYIIQEA